MASILYAFHITLWEAFSIYHWKNKHIRVSDSQNKHIHVDVFFKFEIKSLIRFGSLRLFVFLKAKIAFDTEEICEIDGHTVHNLRQRGLTAEY